MSDFSAMGGYGAYIWSAYAVFFVVLIADALAPVWQRRRTLRDLAGRFKLEAARRSP